MSGMALKTERRIWLYSHDLEGDRYLGTPRNGDLQHHFTVQGTGCGTLGLTVPLSLLARADEVIQ
jgi:hypothetical protein